MKNTHLEPLTAQEFARLDNMFLRDMTAIRALGADDLPLEKLRAKVLAILEAVGK